MQLMSYSYNATGVAVNQLTAVNLDGVQIAAVSYDYTIGRPSGYTYSERHDRTVDLRHVPTPQRHRVPRRAACRSPPTVAGRDARTGKIIEQSVDGVDANPAGANFGYDPLWAACVVGATATPGSANTYRGTYNFTGYTGTAPGCANTQWGRNANRLSPRGLPDL